MKRYIDTKKRWIEIIVYVDPAYIEHVAAGVQLHHPSSKFKFTDKELENYTCFVDSMISPIESHKFYIVKEYQSSKSYAYYVDFFPVDKEGNLLDKVHVIFRIAEHPLKRNSGKSSSTRFIKSFTINDVNYTDLLPFIERVDYICDRLQEGDYNELLEKPTKFE